MHTRFYNLSFMHSHEALASVIAEPIRQYLPSIYGQKMQKYASQGTLSGSFMTLDLTGCLSEAGNDRYLQSSSHNLYIAVNLKIPDMREAFCSISFNPYKYIIENEINVLCELRWTRTNLHLI